MFDQGGFSPNVWRVVCDRPVYILQGIDVHGHEMRPPKIEELPSTVGLRMVPLLQMLIWMAMFMWRQQNFACRYRIKALAEHVIWKRS